MLLRTILCVLQLTLVFVSDQAFAGGFGDRKFKSWHGYISESSFAVGKDGKYPPPNKVEVSSDNLVRLISDGFKSRINGDLRCSFRFDAKYMDMDYVGEKGELFVKPLWRETLTVKCQDAAYSFQVGEASASIDFLDRLECRPIYTEIEGVNAHRVVISIRPKCAQK